VGHVVRNSRFPTENVAMSPTSFQLQLFFGKLSPTILNNVQFQVGIEQEFGLPSFESYSFESSIMQEKTKPDFSDRLYSIPPW